MNKTLTIAASVVLAFHGLIHLMGTAAYLQLAEVQGLPYKTTVLGGSWDLGQAGMGFFGVLWAVAAVGLVVAAIALLLNRTWWQPVLLWVTLLSLVISALDWEVAKTGLVVNLAILVFLGLGSLISISPRRSEAAIKK